MTTLLKNCSIPLVLDADALNILSENTELLNLLPKNSILTPHIKEFDRLVGKSKNTVERLKKQHDFSVKYKVIVVLKDASTCISSKDGVQFFNTSGNPGMATAGSGDVLTGIITGLLAQKYEPLIAALIAVYFHGAAGDLAYTKKGYNAIIASDICNNLRIENINDSSDSSE
jgi:NAD(P)H-hydrate epimerase